MLTRLLSTRRVMAIGALLLLAVWPTAGPARAAEPSKPLRLDELLGLPERLSITMDYRLRYEFLEGQFRAGRFGDDETLALRTRVRVTLALTEWLSLGAELQDSRAYLHDDQSTVNTTIVNTAALLRAYLQFDFDDALGGSNLVQLGRITMDVGSRRLVARNRFRNTSNSFDGLDWIWQSPQREHRVRFFWTLPVQRLPFTRDELLVNEVEFDHENFKNQFAGLFYETGLPCGDSIEAYAFGIYETTSQSRPNQQRRLATPGFRVLRKPSPGHFHYQLEVALQAGKSRAATTGSEDLVTFAHFEHLSAGYVFDVPWAPDLALEYDYASGDKNPTDDENGRFSTLFGARRFDFGPTGIYGPFARANINTPGIRLGIAPREKLSAFVAYRAYWLAQKRDAWVPANVQDPTGESGSFIGSQIELRVRYELLPKNVRLEFGYAHLFAGEFIDKAPNSNREGDSNYVYTQIVFNL